MKESIFIWILLSLLSCRSIPAEINETLKGAGSNKSELKKVLRHYSWKDKDSLKFKAACFLIGNMKWHASHKQISNIDKHYARFCRKADSAYFAIYQEKKGHPDSLGKCMKELNKRYRWLADSAKKYDFHQPVVEYKIAADLRSLKSNFLITHIDNAFRQWETSPFARELTFSEFCEYILPYRSVWGYPSLYSGKEFNQWFAKYVNYDTTAFLTQRISRYNQRLTGIRYFFGWQKMKDCGIYNLFFHGHDCTDVAAFGCSILRSCGIPAIIEFCNTYRDFTGRHFYCAVRDSGNIWKYFNPESTLPDNTKWRMGTTMNLYRQYYGAQPDSPYFLKNKDEHLPPLFSTPCIKEITAERLEVCLVTLPFPDTTTNHLAYLAAFDSRKELVPVTWGIINQEHREVRFPQTMTGRLYFPVYYRGQELCPFGPPFYIKKDSLASGGYRLFSFPGDTSNLQSVVLTRKFPRKPNMEKLAGNLVGGTFEGANRKNFSDARTLCTITEPPDPYLQDIILPHPEAYKFYRFVAPEQYSGAHISELQFLSEKKYGYTNTCEPSPAAILRPEETYREEEDAALVMLQEPSPEKMQKRAVFDGNMQTAASSKTIPFHLKHPQIVTRIRFAPQHADNGIRRDNLYELWYWQDGWKSCGTCTARYEYLEFNHVPENTLLWLQNYSEGQEELPFIIRNKQQLFLYYDIK